MTDIEDFIIDQLYFVTPFTAIDLEADYTKKELANELWLLIEKGWVKCFADPENEIQVDKTDFEARFANYHYLASKKGLLEHNSR